MRAQIHFLIYKTKNYLGVNKFPPSKFPLVAARVKVSSKLGAFSFSGERLGDPD